MNITNLPLAVQEYLKQHDPRLVSITDARGRIVYANPAFIALTGYSANELLGENHRILKSSRQPQEMFEELWYDIAHKKSWQGVIENRAKDGSFFRVDTTITPIPGKSPRDTYYIATRKLI